jgi:hypothetical protein
MNEVTFLMTSSYETINALAAVGNRLTLAISDLAWQGSILDLSGRRYVMVQPYFLCASADVTFFATINPLAVFSPSGST